HAIARAVSKAPWLQSGAPVSHSDRAGERGRLGVYTLPPQASFGGERWRDGGEWRGPRAGGDDDGVLAAARAQRDGLADDATSPFAGQGFAAREAGAGYDPNRSPDSND